MIIISLGIRPEGYLVCSGNAVPKIDTIPISGLHREKSGGEQRPYITWR